MDEAIHALSPATKGLLAGVVMSLWVGPLVGIGAAVVVMRVAQRQSKTVDGGPRETH